MNVLLVDDHAEVRQSLSGFLAELGHHADEAPTGEAALKACRDRRYGLVLSDLRMPGMSGLELLTALEELDAPPPVALMTAFGDADTAIEALRLGAIDYLRKPIRVDELHQLVERLGVGLDAVPQPREEADGLIIADAEMARLTALADRLHGAPDLPVLIEGETGTGKELLARRVHHGGRPSPSPFVALNCAAIAPGLFEAELFGYVPGAFTGADGRGSPGKLAAAAGGSVFLDEIGELPGDQQAKLLRLLEERSWYPVGGQKPQALKARIVCATNRNLVEQVRRGVFREDLYYRLKVGYLRLPPLRSRHGAAPILARLLLTRLHHLRGRGPQRLAGDAEQLVARYPWPGNVRQLRHALERASLTVDGDVLDGIALRGCIDEEPGSSAGRPVVPPPTQAPSPAGARVVGPLDIAAPDLPEEGFDLDAWQQAVVRAALDRNDGSPVRTAAYLRITRKVLYTLRKRYGLLPGQRQG
jgi:DNA-binding NtrC family response regulator